MVSLFMSILYARESHESSAAPVGEGGGGEEGRRGGGEEGRRGGGEEGRMYNCCSHYSGGN